MNISPAPTLLLHASDPLAVALRDLRAEEDTGQSGVCTIQEIHRGHKVALRPIAAGEPVCKFGQVIGSASQAILPGEHIHTHNLVFIPSPASHQIGQGSQVLADLPIVELDTFLGILRPDGLAATRNYIGVLTTVNCSATVARLITDQFHSPQALAAYPNVDGVVALTHKSDCTAKETDESMNLLRRTLGGFAHHPNFAAVLIVGLGCEGNQISLLLEQNGMAASDRLHSFTIQDAGGTNAAVRRGVDWIQSILPSANAITRKPLPISYLRLGLQCGGSDSFSAITANPALGVASDILVSKGGTSILSETPEIYGAENLLLNRVVDQATGQQLLDLLDWWQCYVAQHHETMDSNPTPGNKTGGITTILEKSLGAIAKGGRSTLQAVYHYAEQVRKSGFVFMDTPGFDPVSVTGQVAGGANLICFTTGRGSCFGCKPVPSLKLASNTPLYERMLDDMDINCGQVADGAASINEMGIQIYNILIEIASGRKTKSERLGYGEDEFAPWHFGATL